MPFVPRIISRRQSKPIKKANHGDRGRIINNNGPQDDNVGVLRVTKSVTSAINREINKKKQ